MLPLVAAGLVLVSPLAVSATMMRSLISAAAGWVAGLVAFTFHFLVTVGKSSLSATPALAAISGVAIFLVWLCLLWPLYISVPFRSALWRPLVCIPLGALAGGLILLAFFILLFPGENPLLMFSLPFLYIGPIIGAVTCAVGVVLNSRENNHPRPRAGPPVATPLV